jgi:excisionase family DNA binding protein
MPKTATKKPPLSELRQQFVSVQEAAEMLRISQVSIRRYLGQGKLKRFEVGARTLLRHDEVMGLIRESDVA